MLQSTDSDRIGNKGCSIVIALISLVGKNSGDLVGILGPDEDGLDGSGWGLIEWESTQTDDWKGWHFGVM